MIDMKFRTIDEAIAFGERYLQLLELTVHKNATIPESLRAEMEDYYPGCRYHKKDVATR